MPKGELFAYLGPNRAGKSTTIRILTGLTKLNSGNAYLNGFHIEKGALEAKRQCGIVPQSINLDSELSVFENLDIHGRLFNISRRTRKEQIHKLLEYVGLSGRKESQVKDLSGEMKRRLMIARSMIHFPKILFLDKPQWGWMQIYADVFGHRQRGLKQSRATIFLTTHYIEETEFLAKRVAFLDEGKIATIVIRLRN